jgi:signal transduction histidine kinase
MKPAPDVPGGSILIVDDTPANIAVLEVCLRDAGHRVSVARDGAQALARAAAEPPDLMLLDVLMPGIDGFEVCRRLKADPATAAIPVIFLTASTDRGDQLLAFEVGGVDYLAKPLRIAEMLARVDLQLALRRAQRELAARNEQLSTQMAQEHARTAELRRLNESLQASHRQLEQAQSQLVQSEKMASIGQLAAGVAHEINNPIGFVTSNLGSLEKYLDDLLRLLAAYERHEPALRTSDAVAYAEICAVKQAIELDFLRADLPALLAESKDGLRRVKEIVQGLKDFSHAGTGEWHNADLNAGLESTLAIVNNEIKYKATVEKRLGALPAVECLPLELNQVFMNLLVNAAQAIADKGAITLSSGVEGEHVWVEVADTGCGIPPEHRTRIFDPFFTTKEVGKGTGLGLAISYGIVQKHHGRIDVASEVGHGSTFRVTLPIRQPAQQGAAPEVARDKP